MHLHWIVIVLSLSYLSSSTVISLSLDSYSQKIWLIRIIGLNRNISKCCIKKSLLKQFSCLPVQTSLRCSADLRKRLIHHKCLTFLCKDCQSRSHHGDLGWGLLEPAKSKDKQMESFMDWKCYHRSYFAEFTLSEVISNLSFVPSPKPPKSPPPAIIY